MDGIQAKEEILKVLDELNNRLIAKETELHNLIESNAKLLQRIEQLEESNRKLRNKINRGSSFWKDLFEENICKKYDEIEHRANILEKAIQEQEEIRTKLEERIEAIKSETTQNNEESKSKKDVLEKEIKDKK
uniref:Uncharacterized protein n=1 Tax=Meloidogyne javanica TaxID=6303 RepID=A0A915N7B2_MELJA